MLTRKATILGGGGTELVVEESNEKRERLGGLFQDIYWLLKHTLAILLSFHDQ
jgi:hypothetical protein